MNRYYQDISRFFIIGFVITSIYMIIYSYQLSGIEVMINYLVWPIFSVGIGLIFLQIKKLAIRLIYRRIIQFSICFLLWGILMLLLGNKIALISIVIFCLIFVVLWTGLYFYEVKQVKALNQQLAQKREKND